MKTTKKIYGIALALTCSLAVTLKAQNIYVANYGNVTAGNVYSVYGSIGEYGMDGSTVNASLITGLSGPTGIAISGNDLFVVNSFTVMNSGGIYDIGTIGEYGLDGSTVNASLITGLGSPYGIAISGNDLFVANFNSGTIGEYTTSGATVNASLITGLYFPTAIAISGNNLFVANMGGSPNNGSIGEYTTSGATVNASLMTGLDFPTGIAISGNEPFVAASGGGIAISGSDLFVASGSPGAVSELTTSGTLVNASLITGLDNPDAIAISPVPEPSAGALAALGAAALLLLSLRMKRSVAIL